MTASLGVSGLFLDKIRVFSVQGLNHSGRPWVPMDTHSFSSENRWVSVGTHGYPPFLTAMSCAQSANWACPAMASHAYPRSANPQKAIDIAP